MPNERPRRAPGSGRAAPAGRSRRASVGAHPRRPTASRGRDSLAAEVRSTAQPRQREQAEAYFKEAIELLEQGRDLPALRAARAAKSLAPRAGAAREVLGIALYRAGQFREALRELQAYRRITGRLDQNHLIADSYRALGAPEKALEPVQDALRSRLPDEVRAEAAVVGASALADMGRFEEALGILRSVRTRGGAARPYDLRVWYVAGDVLQRAGRPREAAEEFRRVLRHDAGAFDAAERLAGLG